MLTVRIVCISATYGQHAKLSLPAGIYSFMPEISPHSATSQRSLSISIIGWASGHTGSRLLLQETMI
jgi:hypothetical protein